MTDSDQALTPTETQRLEFLEQSPRARVFDGEPQTVRLELSAGDRIPAHKHPERQIVLHVLEGELELALGDDAHELAAGDLIRFDGRQDISPQAQAETTALLVLAPRAD